MLLDVVMNVRRRLQAAFLDCQFLDLLSHFQDFRAAAVVDVGGCEIAQALVVTRLCKAPGFLESMISNLNQRIT